MILYGVSMGKPKEYKNASERQKAYRYRKKGVPYKIVDGLVFPSVNLEIEENNTITNHNVTVTKPYTEYLNGNHKPLRNAKKDKEKSEGGYFEQHQSFPSKHRKLKLCGCRVSLCQITTLARERLISPES